MFSKLLKCINMMISSQQKAWINLLFYCIASGKLGVNFAQAMKVHHIIMMTLACTIRYNSILILASDSGQFVIEKKKSTSVSHASGLLLAMNFVKKPRAATLLCATCRSLLAPHWEVLRHVGFCWLKFEILRFFIQQLWMLYVVVVVLPGSFKNVAPGHAH